MQDRKTITHSTVKQIIGNLPVTALSRKKFLKRCNNVTRYWNGYIGAHNSHKAWEEFGEPEVILIRNDGWSVTTKMDHLTEAYRLYRDKWKSVIIKLSN